MASTHSTAVTIPETLTRLYTEMAISPLTLLKNYALTHVYATIQKFEIENRSFEQKYDCSFHEFRERIDSQENEEDFRQEDDLMDWEFAVENLRLWITRKEELEIE